MQEKEEKKKKKARQSLLPRVLYPFQQIHSKTPINANNTSFSLCCLISRASSSFYMCFRILFSFLCICQVIMYFPNKNGGAQGGR